MSNFNSLFLVLMLTVALLPITLSEPEDPIQALLKRLNSKRSSPSVQEAAAEAVLERLLPGYVSSFEFKIISDDACGGQSCFLISNYKSLSKNGPPIEVKGSTAVEIASGLYWYLKYWCGAQVSWDKTGGIQIASIPKPGSLPLVKDEGVMIQRPVPWNYYQNVVTSSYSYVWWDWERWEKEIDWMALHGVNLPLAFTGQEAIWQKVFMGFNISKEDLNDFFGGPAFLAWARMANLHGWGGPLSQNWLDQQLALQKRILSRMLELGMTPVLPSFSGNVPAALTKIFPSANITRLGNWGSVNANPRWCCAYLLDPSDPLFVALGEAFVRQQVEEYGDVTDIYNCDTFNENTPPTNDPKYISSLGASVFEAMSKGDKDAVWLSNIQKQAEEYAALIMEELDPDNFGYIMMDSLEMLLFQIPNQSIRGGDNQNLSKRLSQKLKSIQEKTPLRRWCQYTKYFLQDHWRRVWVIALWIGVMSGLFAYKFVEYRHKAAYEVMGHCVCMAKGAAETLKLNMALILLPVCRNTITYLRNRTRLGVVVPFDDNLNFHQIIAGGIAIGVGIHAIYHLACDFPRLIHASSTKYKLMEPFFGDQPSNYWHFIKSMEGVTGILMVVFMAIAFTLASPCFRRSQLNLPKHLKSLTGFNAFWYSHHLFIVVYTLLILHGTYLYLTKDWYNKTTWMYLAVPLALYVYERLFRALRSSIEPVSILKAAVYRGSALSIHMSKPQGFSYKSGQYMFVNCAAISPFEWHPFSLTSAPGDDYLSVHIRAVGDWTRQLLKRFSEVCKAPHSGESGLLRADFKQGDSNTISPKVLIDGPYGAPAQDYKNYEVVLLVGLGIGATPMISIMKDIVSNVRAAEGEEDMSTAAEAPGTRVNNFQIRRAYFYWVTREQGSFDWFKEEMNEVAELDNRGVIELHTYCTSVYEEGDARSALIAMLQSLNHAKNGVDIVSGTRVKSHFAKPNWCNVYESIALNYTNSRVGVFYCGPAAPAKELRQLAMDISHKSSTKFEFHKENF